MFGLIIHAPKRSEWYQRYEGLHERWLNLSILDGWWPEGFNSNGWVIGDESPKGSIEDQDNFDAHCL